MDPVSLATIGTGATVAGGLTSAIGSVLGGIGASKQAQYQAGVAQINRTIALQNADYARKVGESRAVELGLKSRAAQATTLARQGGSGLDVNRGSAAAVRASEGEMGRYEQSVARANAAKTAYGYQVQALEDTAQGQVYQMAGSQALTAGYIGAGSSLLSGAGNVASKWIDYGKAGIPGYPQPAVT
jgi:hypothetical protein